MPMVVMERQANSVTVLELSGQLTIGGGSDILNEKLQKLIAAGRPNLLLDCSQVSRIDSQGISTLVRALISATKRGGKLKLLKPSPKVRQVLDITRLQTVIESFDDEAKAFASF